MNIRLFKCRICGKIIAILENSMIPTYCCAETMEEINPNSVDASSEAHIPIFSLKDNIVKVYVGNISHPMKNDHRIEWIGIKTNKGTQIKDLTPGGESEVCFAICKDEIIEKVYSYCNIHSLWEG